MTGDKFIMLPQFEESKNKIDEIQMRENEKKQAFLSKLRKLVQEYDSSSATPSKVEGYKTQSKDSLDLLARQHVRSVEEEMPKGEPAYDVKSANYKVTKKANEIHVTVTPSSSGKPKIYLSEEGKTVPYMPPDEMISYLNQIKKQSTEQFWDLKEQYNKLQEILIKNQTKNQFNFEKIFKQQYELDNSLGEIYRAGIEEKEELKRVFTAIQEQRIELGSVNRKVESIRLWAKFAQSMGLPPDKHFRAAIENLALQIDNTGGLYQYLEVNLPLVPGLINYKVELGTDHKANIELLIKILIVIWNSIKDWVK